MNLLTLGGGCRNSGIQYAEPCRLPDRLKLMPHELAGAGLITPWEFEEIENAGASI
jgi:hypothetical protein